MSKAILGIVVKETSCYDPDPGSPMSRYVETTEEVIKLFENETDFAKKIFELQKNKKEFKCFKGEFIETPEISISLKI